MKTQWIIHFEKANRHLVDVPPTGFKSTALLSKATKFDSLESLQTYAAERGVFVYRPIQLHID